MVGCHASSVSSRRTSGAAAIKTTSHHASGGAVDIPDNGGMDKVMCLFRKACIYVTHGTLAAVGRRVVLAQPVLRYRYEHRDAVQGCVPGMV